MRLGFDIRVLESGFSGVRAIADAILRGLKLSANPADQVVTFGCTPAADIVLPPRGFMHLGMPKAAHGRVDALVVPRQAAPIYSRVPTVPVFQDVGFIRRPDIYRSSRPIRVANRLAMKCARSAAISSFTSREVQLINTYCNVAPVALPFGAMRTIRRTPDEARPFILTIAAQQPNKNLVELIHAWTKADTADFGLIMCGKEGTDTPAIQAALRTAGQRSNIKVLGSVSEAELEALIASCSGYIQPSLYEGLCIPALDAASSGCPVIVADRGPLQDLFFGGPDGIFMDPSSPRSIVLGIERLIHNPEYRKESSLWTSSAIPKSDPYAIGSAMWDLVGR